MNVPRDGLVAKLNKLTVSQQSIESVASFCVFYAKDAKGVVQIWEHEFYKAPQDRRLALVYLANHILQEGRKKGPAFQEEFYRVLPKTLSALCKAADEKTRKAVTRMVAIWEERRVFGTRHIKSFKDVVVAPSGGAASRSAGKSSKAPPLGPAASALAEAQRAAEASAAADGKFSSEWREELVASSSLQELSAANGLLKSLVTALQAELAARRQALAALQHELASQGAAIAAADARLPLLLQQAARVEQQIGAVTSNMATMLGGGGGGGGGAAGNGAVGERNGGADAGAAGSPQAPAMDDDDDDAAALEGLMQEAHPRLPPQPQPPLLQPQQHTFQAPLQPQQMQPPPPMLQPMHPGQLTMLPPGAPFGGPMAPAPAPQPPQAPSDMGADLQQLLSSGMLAQAIQQVHGGGVGGDFGGQQFFMTDAAQAPGVFLDSLPVAVLPGDEEDQPYDPECPD